MLWQQLNAIQDQGDHETAMLDHEQPEVGRLKMLKHKLLFRVLATEEVQSAEAMILKKLTPLEWDNALELLGLEIGSNWEGDYH